jgi:hypothetical protein
MRPDTVRHDESEADRADLEKFNEMVYSLVFRTPSSISGSV